MPITVNDDRQFGLLIAYVIPGFVIINGVGLLNPTVAQWLAENGDPTLGGFLYVFLSSIGAGITASTIRWMTVDQIHRMTGLRGPNWSMAQMTANLDAFEMLVAYHYRYYQFYGNMLVAIPFVCGCLVAGKAAMNPMPVLGFGVLMELIFFVGSKDTLAKYYSRTQELFTARLIISLFP